MNMPINMNTVRELFSSKRNTVFRLHISSIHIWFIIFVCACGVFIIINLSVIGGATKIGALAGTPLEASIESGFNQEKLKNVLEMYHQKQQTYERLWNEGITTVDPSR